MISGLIMIYSFKKAWFVSEFRKLAPAPDEPNYTAIK